MLLLPKLEPLVPARVVSRILDNTIRKFAGKGGHPKYRAAIVSHFYAKLVERLAPHFPEDVRENALNAILDCGKIVGISFRSRLADARMSNEEHREVKRIVSANFKAMDKGRQFASLNSRFRALAPRAACKLANNGELAHLLFHVGRSRLVAILFNMEVPIEVISTIRAAFSKETLLKFHSFFGESDSSTRQVLGFN